MPSIEEILDQFSAQLPAEESHVLQDVRDFLRWEAGRRVDARHAQGDSSLVAGEGFVPHEMDDVDLRTYLLHRRLGGMGRERLKSSLASLERFYSWLEAEGIIESSPFEDFDFDQPLLSREEIRRRQEAFTGPPQTREIARLQALNRLAREINRAPDFRTALQITLQSMLEVMGLHTGWAFLLSGAGLAGQGVSGDSSEFLLAAAAGLPPGLEASDRYFLTSPPDCHCQHLLRDGRLTRAVNIVECTRLQRAAAAQGDNRNLRFHASVPIKLQGEAVGVLNFATDEWQFLSGADLQLLTAAGEHLSAAMERFRLYELSRSQRELLERELAMARAVQASLVPELLPKIPGFELASAWRPARQVSGDFFDVLRLPDGRWGLVIGDVADKGAPAALYMAMTISVVRAHVDEAGEPGRLLSRVNQALSTHPSQGMFVTMLYIILDAQAGWMEYASAGHYPPLVRRVDGRVEELPLGGIAMGVFPEAEYVSRVVELAPGELLLAFTDGLIDALNPEGAYFGQERLEATLAASPASAAAACDAILSEIGRFVAGTAQYDDITLLLLERQVQD